MQKELSQLTDQELLQEAKKMKTYAIIDAALIGFLVGIVFVSIFTKRLGFLTLILLFFIYKIINKPKYDKKELDRLLKERNLK